MRLFKVIFTAFLMLNFLHGKGDANSSKVLFKATSKHFIHKLAYSTENNFLGQNLYAKFGLNECFLHEDLRGKMAILEQILAAKRLKIIFYDCFRPNEAQKIAWEKVSDENFVANPYKNGSNHSRAIALDVGLADENGTALPMPSGFDEFAPNARADYVCEDDEKDKCENRELLRKIMQNAGFKGIKSEWWHFEAEFKGLSRKKVWEKYPILENLE